MKRLLIFAGSYPQALHFAQERGCPPSQFTYACDRWRVMGLDVKQFETVTTGTWKQNEEVVEAYQYWMTRPIFPDQHSGDM